MDRTAELNDYIGALRQIAETGDPNITKFAAETLQKHDPKAHYCWAWDGMFIGTGSDELEACRCFTELPPLR